MMEGKGEEVGCVLEKEIEELGKGIFCRVNGGERGGYESGTDEEGYVERREEMG